MTGAQSTADNKLERPHGRHQRPHAETDEFDVSTHVNAAKGSKQKIEGKDERNKQEGPMRIGETTDPNRPFEARRQG
jgi:hypothetical protein